MGTNDFCYSLEILETVLQVVSDLSAFEYRDLEFSTPCDCYQLYQEASELVKCIIIRAFYKGMHGDVRNLQSYATVWHKRSLNPDWTHCFQCFFDSLDPITESSVAGRFSFEDVTIEGIDCGCSGLLSFLLSKPNIVQALEQQQIASKHEYLERQMWGQRSGLNTRKFICEKPGFENIAEYSKTSGFLKDEFFYNIIIPAADAYSRKEAYRRLQ
jgi:hypothetical protein